MPSPRLRRAARRRRYGAAMSATGTSRVEARPAWMSAMPAAFVVLWSTGFIGAKLGLPYAGPLTFLALRFGLVTAIMLAAALASGAAWPGLRESGHAAVVGLLIQFTYLGGVFFGISRGVSAGVAALIVGIQPLLTAALAGTLLGDRVTRLQWAGLALGLAGVVFVVWEKVDLSGVQTSGLLAVVGALLGITLGTLYQKRYCGGIDLRSATVLQNASAGVAMLACAFLFEPMRVAWTGEFVFALLWLCLVLSVGATILLLWLIRRGAASRVASLFYLVPPVTAFMAFLLFGETLGIAALAGMGLTMAGVALVNRG
jgi:drug/metabolite transporter (DMT)-like permease